MKAQGVNFIECEGFHVAATVENPSCTEQRIYYPANFLIHLERGRLELDLDEGTYVVNEGEYVFIRKHTHGTFRKTWNEEEGSFKEQIFVFQDPFLKEVIRDFTVPADMMPCTVPLVKITHSPVLKGLMSSLEIYVTGQARIDRQLIKLKTMEALHALAEAKPELIHVLNEFSDPYKADLVNFVENNFTRNLSLEQFAQLSGRSLSTFTREFNRTYKQTPSRWFKQKRLDLARQMIQGEGLKASEVYMEVGFEDLAHFSRSFKSQFGMNPTEAARV